ncbi:hypothetical protein BGX38DRAFT_1159117, partial [Terfezia claveryi]
MDARRRKSRPLSLFLLLPESLSQFGPPHKLYTPPIEDLLLIWLKSPKFSYTKQILVAGGDEEGGKEKHGEEEKH